MRNTGVADQCLLAPELEFFVFDNVQFDQRGHEAFYHVDSVEGAWNRGRAENAQPRLQARLRAGLFPLSTDRQPGRPPHPRWPSAWPNAALRRRPTFMRSPPAASARST